MKTNINKNKKKNPLRIISILIGGSSYRDRMSMLFALDTYVDEHIIITREEDCIAPIMKNTKVVRPWLRMPSILFAWWAGCMAVIEIIRSSQKGLWIVNEDFTRNALLIVRRFCKRRCLTCISIVIECRKSWNSDPHMVPITKRQNTHYSSLTLHREKLFKRASYSEYAVIVNGEGIKEDVLNLNPKARVYVVPNSATIQDINQQLSVSSIMKNDITFLYVGVLQPQKGIGSLLAGFSLFAKSHPHAKLLMVGKIHSVDHDWFQQLYTRYSDNPQILRMASMKPDTLAHVYKQADIFVFPSFLEGSPRVVNEALAFGLPIIASDIPSIRTIDPEARAIQYFQPGDIFKMSELMTNIADNADLRRSLREKSKALSLEFSHEKIAFRLASAYRFLIDQ